MSLESGVVRCHFDDVESVGLWHPVLKVRVRVRFSVRVRVRVRVRVESVVFWHLVLKSSSFSACYRE